MSHVPDRPAGVQSTDTDLRETRGSRGTTLDAIFDVLSAERRRHVLYVLYRRSDDVAVEDLADAVASAVGANSARVVADLYHVHLPKLAEEGIVEYDRDAGVARFDTCSDQFDRYLASAADDDGEPLRRGSDT